MDEVDKFLNNENEFIIEKLDPNINGEQNKEYYGSLYLTNKRLINFKKTDGMESFQDFTLEHITSVKFTSLKYNYESFNLLRRKPSFLFGIFLIIFGALMYFLIGIPRIGNDNSDSFDVSISFFFSICLFVFIFIGSVGVIDIFFKVHTEANNGFLIIDCYNKIVLKYPISDKNMLNKVPKLISFIHSPSADHIASKVRQVIRSQLISNKRSLHRCLKSGQKGTSSVIQI